MSISPKSGVALALAALAGLVAVAAGVYLYRSHHAGAAIDGVPDLVAELPADAPVIAYIDVAALRQLEGSTLATLLGLAESGPDQDREYRDFVRDTGFQYERDLDRAALAFWPQRTESSRAPQTNDVLAIASGRFDQPKIQAYALRSGAVVTSGKKSLYRIPGDPVVSFEFLSSTSVVLASGANVEAHLLATRSSGVGLPLRGLVSRVSSAPLFAAARADSLPESIYASLGQSPQVTEMVRSVQAFTLAGRPNGDDLDVVLDAQCESASSALELSTLLGGVRIFGSLALSNPKTNGRMTKEQAALLSAVLAGVEIRQEANWVRVSLAVTPAMLSAAGSGGGKR
jgi:hypothetical protein